MSLPYYIDYITFYSYLKNSNNLIVKSSSFVLSKPIDTVGLILNGGTGINLVIKFTGCGGYGLPNKYYQ